MAGINIRKNLSDPTDKLRRLHESRMAESASLELYQSCFTVVVANRVNDAQWNDILRQVELMLVGMKEKR